MNANESCPVQIRRPMSLRQTVKALRVFSGSDWLKAAVIGMIAALLIGIPTVLIPNPFFQRMIPTTPMNYVVYIISVMLIGMTWAIPESPTTRRESKSDKPEGNHHSNDEQTDGKQSIAGLVVAIFAVGCPTCNVLVLWLLGAGGAMTYFAPLQPIIGIAAITLLLVALMRRASRLNV